jgi:hypothetical protein
MPIHGIRTVYQPFSLQERMAPLAMMKEEYDKVNEGLAELGMTTNQVAQYIDPNSEAGKTLAQYNQTLDDAAETLSREGLKGLSRTALYNLKRTYQSQIAPINEGAKNYAALQAQIKQMQWKDPTIMVNGMPTLDEYIKNPNALPNLVSGAQLQQEGIKAALQLPGVNYETISRYLNGDMSAIPDLNVAAQRIADNYGVSTEQAMGYITNGVMSGLGQRATELYDKQQELLAKEQSEMRLARFKTGQQAWLDDRRTANDIAAARAKAAFTGSGAGSGTKSGAGKSQFVNTTMMVTKKDYDTVYKDFMDKKTGEVKLSDSLFKDGKLSKPEPVYGQGAASNFGGGSGMTYQLNSGDTRAYDKLVGMLGNYYSTEQIANMSKQEVEQAIRGIAGEQSMDVQGANQYYWNVKADATKELLSTINNGHEVRKIKDRNPDGTFVYGKSSKLDKAKDGETVQVRYDPMKNKLILKREGEYYEIPQDVLPQEVMRSLSSYTTPDANGLSWQQRASIYLDKEESMFNSLGISPSELVANVQQNIALGRAVSPEMMELAQEAMKYLSVYDEYQNMDSFFGSIGNTLNSYTGSANLNK